MVTKKRSLKERENATKKSHKKFDKKITEYNKKTRVEKVRKNVKTHKM